MKLRNNKNKKIIKAAVNFQPFDYYYLLEIEKAALEKMAEYLSTSDIAVDDRFNSNRIKLALRILDIVNDEGLSVYSGKHNVYINTRNASRFYPKDCKFDLDNKVFKADLRYCKAWHLYNIIKEYNFLRWWN